MLSRRYVLHSLMRKNCAEWSLLLLLLLLKTERLVNFGIARYDLWDKLVDDFEESAK